MILHSPPFRPVFFFNVFCYVEFEAIKLSIIRILVSMFSINTLLRTAIGDFGEEQANTTSLFPLLISQGLLSIS